MAFAEPHTTAGAISTAMPRDFLALMKPRVMSLVVFTALVGMVIAPVHLNPVLAAISILAIAIGGGAAGALNMWFDADIDAAMARTSRRPIPAGAILPGEALAFGILLAVFSVAILGLIANWLAAGLLAFTIFFYAVVYTIWLKRRTPQNIVIGGAAGALPPVIGWAAMTGSLSVEPFLLFAIIFLWTPPHFWALALYASTDYRRAGVPMLPNVAGAAATRRHIFAYSLVLVASAMLPAVLGFAGIAYAAIATLLGVEFTRRAWRVLQATDRDHTPARALFGYSIFYLFAIFAALPLERLLVPLAGLAGVR
jgi:protoheme IX farnesyltransferase